MFDDVVESSLRAVANQIAAGSAFVPQQDPFHVAFLGSLHTYSTEQVNASIASAPPVRGRWLAFELHQQQLRMLVELEPDGAAACLSLVKAHLPLGKPWRTHYVTLGSAADIDSSVHGEFLAAVEQAFPIDATALFALTRLAYHNPKPIIDAKINTKLQVDTQKKAGAATAADAAASAAQPARPRLNPKARPFVPAYSSQTTTAKMNPPKRKTIHKKQHLKNKMKHTTSPHMTWQRTMEKDDTNPNATACELSSMDALIRSTGATGLRRAKPGGKP